MNGSNRNCWILNWSDGNTNNNNLNNNNYVRAFAEYPKASVGKFMMLEIDTTDNATIPFTEFVESYLECRRAKRSKDSSIEFEMNWESNVYSLYEEVNRKTYDIGQSIVFVTTRPKKREVFAASFRDRVIHHLVCRKLVPLFESYFIHDTYNCRVGKGTDYGVRRLYQSIKKVSNNYTRNCYVAKFDMQGFFMSIHKPTLWLMLKKFIIERYFGKDKELILWLVEKIVLHSPEKKCIRKMPSNMWKGIPDNKSLFTNGEDYGLPIGNLTSQIFANFYLTNFDMQMSRKFVYGRYVDDFYIVDTDKNAILNTIPLMRNELAKLQVSLHPTKIYIQEYHRGVNFTGSVIKKGRIYISKRTVHNFKQAIFEINKCTDKRQNLEHTVQVINSYLGFLVGRRSYKIRHDLLYTIDKEWFEYFTIYGDCKKVVLKKQYRKRVIMNNIMSALKKSAN